jgi:ribonuclease HII
MIEELNRVGLSAGLRLAAARAACEALTGVAEDYQIVVDGTVNFLRETELKNRTTVLKKADQLVAEVSAASIVAKCARDAYMIELGAKYPAYGFERHMGYGTAAHLAALMEHGPCAEHRTFCRPVAEAMRQHLPPAASPALRAKTALVAGQQAEGVVAEHLVRHGHVVLARNYRVKAAELDIVSEWKGEIFVTEVKYRRSERQGGGLAAIDVAKIRRLRLGAAAFLREFGREEQNVRLLAAAVTVDFKVVNVVEI